MKIIDVETTLIRLPDVKPIGDGTQDCLIVQVHTDEGITGIGEVNTAPSVARAIIEAPISQLSSRGLKEILLHQNPLDIQVLWDKMYAQTAVYGRRGVVIHTISAIDIALWDILGKVLKQPVYQLLGGAYRKTVNAYASDLAPATVDEAIERVARYKEEGFRAVKFGWGGIGQDVRQDIEYLRRLREAAGSELDIMIDIGVPIPLTQAQTFARAAAESDLYFLEEPLSPDDLDGYAVLNSTSPVPIACGEKESTVHGFKDLLERGKMRVLQPDVARIGGLTEARKLATLAQHYGVTLIPHCWSTNVLVAATMHYIASLPICPYLEFCVLDNPIRRDVTTQAIPSVGGEVAVPGGDGLGIELNFDTLRRLAV